MPRHGSTMVQYDSSSGTPVKHWALRAGSSGGKDSGTGLLEGSQTAAQHSGKIVLYYTPERKAQEMVTQGPEEVRGSQCKGTVAEKMLHLQE